MRSAYMLDFPVAEYEARVAKMANLLKEAGMDAVILTTETNLRYFCGFQSIVWSSGVSTPGLLVITADGGISLIGAQSGHGTLVACSCIDEADIYTFGNQGAVYAPSFAHATGKVLEEKKLTKGKVGMELGAGFRLHLSHPDYLTIMSYLQEADVQDASGLIWKLRAVKSEAELEYVRRACKINCDMYSVAFNSVFPGKTTEEDVFRTMAKVAYELGAMRMDSMGIRSGSDRYFHGNCMPTPRIIGTDANEMMLIDGGPVYKGYCSDILRQGVVGEPTQIQKEAYAYTVDLTEYAMSTVKAGVRIADTVKMLEAYAAKHEKFYSYYTYHGSMGHSIGLGIHEMPLLSSSSEWEYQENMIIAIEPTITIANEGRFGIEQNLRVTKDGVENLTPLSTELYQLR